MKSKAKSPSGQKSTRVTPKSGHSGPFRTAAIWRHQEAPLILTKVGGKQTFIATSFSPVSFEKILDLNIAAEVSSTNDASSGGLPRWLFVVPYETARESLPSKSSSGERVLAWEIFAGLIWDDDATEPRYAEVSGAANARFHLPMKTALKTLLSDASKYHPAPHKGIDLLPSTSDDTYVETVKRLINDIREGAFYQINLLRFFNAPHAHGWENLCALMESNTGPHGTLVTQGSRVIASLSPERFIEINPSASGLHIKTWPIKGTAPRYPDDPKRDQQSAETLSHSEKDRAELRMIIDLMRNDLIQICEPGSVNVTQEAALRKFSHIWHLEGEVTGQLKADQKIQTILQALCPGGSITGAPKIAAMSRIDKDEGQTRGYFMGNVFRINYDGSLQSSIMIRTLVSDNWMNSARYAAGSGIVIKSDPHAELEEIRAKCAVVTNHKELSK